MLKIGEFAQLAQVTIKMLRHYDRLGILAPAHIDPQNGYRYYQVEQLPQIHRILALKEIGLSLEQIGVLLSERVSNEQIRGMLRLRQAEIRQQVEAAQRQQEMVSFRLRMLEAEENFPSLDVVIKPLEPMRVLSLFAETVSKRTDGPHHMPILVSAIEEAIAKECILWTGKSIDVFHGETIMDFDSPEMGDRQHEILLGVASTQESVMLDGIGHWHARNEPGIAEAATLIVAVDDENTPNEFEQATLLRRWAVAHGYRPDSTTRFWHHRGPMQTLNRYEFMLEIQLPLLSEE